MIRLSHFMRDALTMGGGAAIAQIIPFAAVPLLARLYSPEEFGLLATIVALSAAVSLVSTARYELAVVLPKDDEVACALTVLAFTLATATCSIALGAATLVATGVIPVEGLRGAGWWLFVVPFLAFLMATGQIGSFVHNRERAYRAIATAAVGQQLVNACIAIALGMARAMGGGLIIARIVGAISYVVILRAGLRRNVRLDCAANAWSCAKKYRQFPFFNLPYSLLSSISKDLLIFLFAWMGEIVAAGLLAMARTLMLAPIMLLSGALSQVFYKETAISVGTAEHKRLTQKMLETTALAFVPGYLLVGWWGPEVFALVLGERWREAGAFAAPLAVAYALGTLTSWPERIFESRSKQHWALSIQATFDILTFSLVLLVLSSGFSSLAAVQTYAAVQCLYHIAYLGAVCRLAEIDLMQYLRLLTLVAVLVASTVTLGWALSSAQIGTTIAFSVHATAVTILLLVAVVRLRTE